RQSSRLARVVTPDHTSVARTGSIRVMAVDAKTPSQVEGKTKRGRENGPGSVDRLSLALEASGLGIWTIDLAFRAAEWSERCRELLGVERGAELTEESFLERVHPDDRVLVRSALAGAIEPRSNGAFTIDHRVVHPDGTIRWARLRGRVISAGNDRAPSCVGTLQDVTEEVRAAEDGRFALALGALLSSIGDPDAILAAVHSRLVWYPAAAL